MEAADASAALVTSKFAKKNDDGHFLTKLHDLCTFNGGENFIRWTEDGKGIEITVDQFSKFLADQKEPLKYSKNWRSFRASLTAWRFKKLDNVSAGNKVVYSHDLFRPGKREAIPEIIRAKKGRKGLLVTPTMISDYRLLQEFGSKLSLDSSIFSDMINEFGRKHLQVPVAVSNNEGHEGEKDLKDELGADDVERVVIEEEESDGDEFAMKLKRIMEGEL